MKLEFEIPGDCIAKKNSQTAIRLGKRNMIIPSKQYQRWEKATKAFLLGFPAWEGTYPVKLRFYHYRATNRAFDLSNMMEGTQDVLQAVGILAEDNMRHVIPVIDGLGWEKDAERPRVRIIIEEYHD